MDRDGRCPKIHDSDGRAKVMDVRISVSKPLYIEKILCSNNSFIIYTATEIVE